MKILFCIRQQQDASTGGLLHAAGLKRLMKPARLCNPVSDGSIENIQGIACICCGSRAGKRVGEQRQQAVTGCIVT